MRKLLSLLLLFVLMALTACGQSYTYCELTLPLPGEYKGEASDMFDAVYSDGYATVSVTRITFSAAFTDGIPDTYSPLQLARFYQLNNSHDGIEINADSHVPRYSYTGSTGDGEIYVMHTFYRSPYAYFIVTYTCDAQLFAKYEADFIRYADGAYFSDYKPNS